MNMSAVMGLKKVESYCLCQNNPSTINERLRLPIETKALIFKLLVLLLPFTLSARLHEHILPPSLVFMIIPLEKTMAEIIILIIQDRLCTGGFCRPSHLWLQGISFSPQVEVIVMSGCLIIIILNTGHSNEVHMICAYAGAESLSIHSL